MNPARDLLKKFDSALANDDFVPEAEEMCETFEAAADRIDALEAELAQLRKWVYRGLGACPLCAKTIWVQQVWQIAGTVGVGDGAQWRVDCNHPFVTAPHCCAWQGPVADTPEAAWKAAAEEMAQ